MTAVVVSAVAARLQLLTQLGHFEVFVAGGHERIFGISGMDTGVAHTVAQLVDGAVGDNGRQRFVRTHSVDRAVGARTGRVHSTPLAATAATLRGQDTIQANFTDGRRFHLANCNFAVQTKRQ